MAKFRSRRQSDLPFVMGVLNVTPDSFSDGGDFIAQAAAVTPGLTGPAPPGSICSSGSRSSCSST